MTKHTLPLDFLATWDKDIKFLQSVITVADLLRTKTVKSNLFTGELAVSIFKDQSTRTRYSYAAAASMLGLTQFDFEESKSQIVHGETTHETANMVGFVSRCFGIRDDIYLGIGHRYMTEVAQGLDWGYQNDILPHRPTLINLQSDEDHPTQSLSDLAHLSHYFGGINKLKGKKITVSWAYSPSYGKPLSVPQGLIALLSRFGAHLTLAYPPGYNLMPTIETYAKQEAKKSGGSFTISHDMRKGFAGAQVVYPKSWAPFTVMEQRTKLLQSNDTDKLKDLEKEGLAMNAKHKEWTCSEVLMKSTDRGQALYMHCLPADISGVSCKVGEVVSSVFDQYRKQVYEQASYKPYIIASIIVLCQNRGNTVKVKKLLSKTQNTH